MGQLDASHLVDRKNFLTRQSEILNDKELATSVLLVGCGAVGSNLLQQLVKMGLSNVTLFDADHVSVENMNSQGFTPPDIGKNKAELCAQYAALFGLTYQTNARHWTGQSFAQKIVICGADSMEVRKNMFESAIANKKSELFLESRMAAQKSIIFCVDLSNEAQVESYRRTLYSDADAVQSSCTNKATIFCASVTAGLLTNSVKAWITKREVLRHITMIDFINSTFD